MKSSHTFFLLSIILLIEAIVSGLFLPTVLHLMQLINHHNSKMPQIDNEIQDVLFGSGFIILLSPMYLFFSPIIGISADQWGRKRFLTLAVICAIIGYSGILMGISTHSLMLILMGLIIYSISNTDLPLIMSMTTDITLPENRASYFIVIQGLSLVLIIAGQVGDNILQSHWAASVNAPVRILGILIALEILNLIFVRCLPETLLQKSLSPKITTEEILNRFIHLFTTPGIKSLLLYLISIYFVWGLYFQHNERYMIQILHWTSSEASHFLIYQYSIMMISLLVIYVLMKRFDLRRLLLAGIFTTSIGFIGSCCFQHPLNYILFALPFNFGLLLVIISCWTLLSHQGKNQQGLLMSLIALSWAIAWMLSGIYATHLSEKSINLPLHMAAIGGITLLLGVMGYERNKASRYG